MKLIGLVGMAAGITLIWACGFLAARGHPVRAVLVGCAGGFALGVFQHFV